MAQNSKKLEDGREIIAREHNTEGPHPHPAQNGKLVPFHNVNKLLVLDPNDVDNPDGVTLFECDMCGKNFSTVKQVVSHMTMHSDRGSEYSEDIIKTVLQVAVDMHAVNIRGWRDLAAAELNKREVATARGGKWSAGAVGHIMRTYLEMYPTRPTRRRRLTVAGAAATTSSTTSTATPPATVSEIRSRTKTAADTESTSVNVNTLYRVKVRTISDAVTAVDHLAGVAMKISTDAVKLVREAERLRQDIADAVARAAITPAPAIDPEIVEKAKLYDQFSGLFGSLIQNNNKK